MTSYSSAAKQNVPTLNHVRLTGTLESITPVQPTKGIPVLPVGHLRRDGDGCAAEVGDRRREAEAALQGRRGRHVALPLLCPSLSLLAVPGLV